MSGTTNSPFLSVVPIDWLLKATSTFLRSGIRTKAKLSRIGRERCMLESISETLPASRRSWLIWPLVCRTAAPTVP